MGMWHLLLRTKVVVLHLCGGMGRRTRLSPYHSVVTTVRRPSITPIELGLGFQRIAARTAIQHFAGIPDQIRFRRLRKPETLGIRLPSCTSTLSHHSCPT